ncbi:hypothetical protein A5634_13125 [Mycobacterium asiaticum]|uniref:UsfY protein n=1 Tax=Mycobacterium asiaticum TaxID=1790 RepID=A0A1A3PE05_MYCAS|nr:hypothetical protein [Mycobacterium asiaticum]OBK31534.1 hypothetical protein A5634_13125 [Mycobacterium asiaticum]
MADSARDPLGPDDLLELEKRAERTPEVVVIVGAVLAFVISVAAFALGQAGAGIVAGSVGMLVFGAGLSWLGMERRRVRDAERDVRFGDPS